MFGFAGKIPKKKKKKEGRVWKRKDKWLRISQGVWYFSLWMNKFNNCLCWLHNNLYNCTLFLVLSEDWPTLLWVQFAYLSFLHHQVTGKKISTIIWLTIGCVNLQLKKVQNEGQSEAVKNAVLAFSYSADCCTKIKIAQSAVCTFSSISAFIHHSQLASLWKLNYIFNTNHTSFVLNERSAWAHGRTGSLLMQCYHMHWGQYLTSHSTNCPWRTNFPYRRDYSSRAFLIKWWRERSSLCLSTGGTGLTIHLSQKNVPASSFMKLLMHIRTCTPSRQSPPG